MDSQAASTEAAAVKKHELVWQLKFPPGFRFVPSEEELVDVYLRGKIEGRKLPLDVVNEVSILEWQPGRLVEAFKAYGEHKWYFFTEREPSSSKKEKEPNRKVRVPGVTATWKATGSVTEIRRKGKDGKPLDMVGTKRVLIYHSSDAHENGKWSMHEYVLNSNSEIGQYALCSIQRKQHSDTENAGGQATGSSKPKRKTTTDTEPGKATKRNKKASTQAEGAQLQKQETTPQHGPPEPPLTPPKQDHQILQQEPPLSESKPTSLPAVPVLQGYPSEGNQHLGVSAPMNAGHADARSYQCRDISSQILMQNHVAFCNQVEQPPILTWSQTISQDSNVDGFKYQLYEQENYGTFGVPDQHVYTEQYLQQDVDFLSGDTTQNNSNWGLDQDQLYQQVDEDAITYVQDYQSYDQGHFTVFGHETGYGSPDQFTKSVQGESGAFEGDDDVALFSAGGFLGSDLELIFTNLMRIDGPQDKVGGTEEGSNPALQSQHEVQRPCGQQQHVANGHVCRGPSSGCAVCS